MYAKYIKRCLDFILSVCGLIVLSPILVVLTILGSIFMYGNPFFIQERPGKDEKIFKLIKFRTMDNRMDAHGNLLPDEVRLSKYGRFLRRTSLDELPELINIVKGDMSIVGPRPQLVRDMVFMTSEQRRRHTVRQGLTGWAQVNGRNGISWENKLKYDIEYIDNITFIFDLKILFMTVATILKKDGIVMDDMATAMDYGDYLLGKERISIEEYNRKQMLAKKILSREHETENIETHIDFSKHEPFSVAMSVYENDSPEHFERAISSITENQTIVPNEIVLVVDGPINERLNSVIKKYETKYEIFNVIYLKENGGLGNALKVAVENAKYDLIARMDSDDMAIPTRFEEQLKYFILHPEVDIVGGDITEFIGDETNIVGRRCVPTSDKKIREYMKNRCAMNHVSVMYKKTSVQAVGGYKEWFCNEDYYLWIRMWLNNAVFANTGTVLVNVRVGKEMYQRRGGRKYFKSETRLQEYMLENKMIGKTTYCMNIIKRFIVQILLPNKIRGWVFRTFARK